LPAPAGSGEDRVLVGSFASIDAVAVTRRFVFAVGPGGVAVYDRLGERFMPPASRDLDREVGRDPQSFSAPAPIGFGASITAMAGDPVEDALWIGVPGAVITYRPFTGQVQRTIVTGVPQRIVFDRSGNGDALVQSGGQWTRLSRVGLATPANTPMAQQIIVPPTLADLVNRYPGLRAQPQLLLRRTAPNRPIGNFALTAAAASPDRASELWLGTDGEGLFRFDPVFGQGSALPYGLLETGAGALAPAADGVWVAGLGLSRRGGLTFASTDLQRWRWIEGTIAVPMAGVRTFALATRGARAWLGTERGLVRVQLDSAQDMQAFSALGGLPDDRVFAVAARDAGAWAGTSRGLVFVSDSLGAGEPVLREAAVYALQVTGSTLWAGTQRGLFTLPADGSAGRGSLADAPRAANATDVMLRAPIRALAASDTVLLVATDDAVVVLNPRNATVTLVAQLQPALDPRLVGEVTRVAADERAFAVAGRDGLVLASRVTGAQRAMRVPLDLPGPVFDVLLQRDAVFLATAQGLLRYRRTSDGLVP
jgi:ligand-binding sensor domain-containing protein